MWNTAREVWTVKTPDGPPHIHHPAPVHLHSNVSIVSKTELPKEYLYRLIYLPLLHPPPPTPLSLMGTGHQTHEKKGSGSFPCNRMKLAHDDRRPDATRQVMGGGGDHLSTSSVLLNMRMALEILRAGPSLMLMIFTMSVWVSSRKASPSIIWEDADTTAVMQLVGWVQK